MKAEVDSKLLDNLIRIVECCHMIDVLEDLQRERGHDYLRMQHLKNKRQMLNDLVNDNLEAARSARINNLLHQPTECHG